MVKRLSYSATPTQRFERMYQPVPFSGCWLWTGALSSDGYGSFFVEGRSIQAHKFSFEQDRRKMLAGEELDHLCRVRCCVNPAHVEAVTHRVNMLRGEGIGSQNFEKTHCDRGHPFDAVNTAIRRGARICKRCDVIRARLYRQRRAS